MKAPVLGHTCISFSNGKQKFGKRQDLQSICSSPAQNYQMHSQSLRTNSCTGKKLFKFRPLLKQMQIWSKTSKY